VSGNVAIVERLRVLVLRSELSARVSIRFDRGGVKLYSVICRRRFERRHCSPGCWIG